ncbi:DUF485 domain-containing protein [Sulfurimonas sp.]
MKKEWVDIINEDDGYHYLVKKRMGFAIKLTLLMLFVYFAYILTIAYEPSILAQPINEGSVITIAIPVGVFVIVFAFVLTGIYTYIANSEFDTLSNEIKRKLKEKIDE